jgi:polysaccharide export outer membrane protein
MKIFKLTLPIILLLMAIGRAQTTESYVIGIDDKLSIKFWQEPDLNTEIRVSDNGMITLPVIGDIRAEGKTTAELAKLIAEQMAYYNPGISQATVIVTEYNSRTVVLAGAVVNPGEYHFERIPNLLDLIRQAGGALPTADLSNVTVIRQVDGKAQIIKVDVLKRIRDGDLTALPELRSKDMVNVPISPYGATAEIFGAQTFTGKNIYFIYGAVNQPGVKALSEDLELLDAIAAAGGTTPEADWKNISVVVKDVRYSSILKFNIDDFSKTGRPARYKLNQEDTIIVPYRRENIWSRLPDIVVPALISALITSVLVRGI